MTAYTATSPGTDLLAKQINLAAHGFVVGDLLIYNGAWTKATSDLPINCSSLVVVSFRVSADVFFVTQVGAINGLTLDDANNPFNVGQTYYLSRTAPGKFTPIPNTGVGQVLFPCLKTTSATEGFFTGGFGQEIETGTLFAWTEIDANQTLAVNQGYYVNGGGALNALLLPAVAALGDTIELWDIGGNGFTVTQSAGQSIIAGTVTSTVGIGGNVQSTAKGNKIVINCYLANLGFIADVSMCAGASVIVT